MKNVNLSGLNNCLFKTKNPLIKFTSIDKIEKNYNFDRLKELTVNPRELTMEQIRNYKKNLKNKNKLYFCKGKELIEFLKIFLEKLKNNQGSIRFNGKVSLDSSGNLLSVLSQYAEIPEELKSFLEDIKAN